MVAERTPAAAPDRVQRCRDLTMALPIPIDLQPMEATLVDTLPEGEGWLYEPK